MKLFVFDLDKTLIDTREVIDSGGPEPVPGTQDHEDWVRKVTDATVLTTAKHVPALYDLTTIMNYIYPQSVVFITNRRESMRQLTVNWLDTYGIGHIPLYMRPEGNLLSAGDFKSNVIKGIVENTQPVKYEITVFDDDTDGSIERVCRENGWTHLKVTTYP